MSVGVNPPKTPVTEGSNGVAAATVPNVCKMPGPPAPFVPTPLPNIGRSGMGPKGYSTKTTIEGKKIAIRGATFGSMGDVASKGTGGGLVSSSAEGSTSFVGPGSMNVKVEGKNVQLLGDPMLNNCGPGGSPANAATLMGVIQASGLVVAVQARTCRICKKEHKEFVETEATRVAAGTLAEAYQRALHEKVLAAKERVDARGRERATAEEALAKADRALADAQAAFDRAQERLGIVMHAGPDPASAGSGAAGPAESELRGAQNDSARARSELGRAKSERPRARALLEAATKDHAAAVEALKAAEKANRPTMLGVVACQCPRNYAGQSGATTTELVAAARQRDMKCSDPTPTPDAWAQVKASFEERARRSDRFGKAFRRAWTTAEARSNPHPVKGRPAAPGPHMPGTPVVDPDVEPQSYYPPGNCAAQKALVLARRSGGLPQAMTERWYSPKAERVVGAIRYMDAGKVRAKHFEHGETVPPCGSCTLLLPLLLCPEDKTTCQHREETPCGHP